MRHDYPILLDVSARKCVIIGGGEVAARKAGGLLDSGAKDVVVVAPEFKATFPAGVKHVRGRYQPAHLDGAGIVFAATDLASVNDQIVRDAMARNILVSRVDVDDALAGDFVIPAKFREGPVTITVSAGSAALAVMIRDELAKKWNANWTALAKAMQTLRPEVRQNETDPARRRAILRRLASQEAMDLLNAGGLDALRTWMKE